MSRIASIDLLRGIVMVLMALDHIRYFFHIDAGLYSPTDLQNTTPAVFLTRWVTHFCGPVFVFLAGLSAYLTVEKNGIRYVSRFLLTRGLWLILLELFVFRLGWNYHYLRPSVDLLIIWVIGVSMLFLGVSAGLPRRWILGTGLFILFAHNLLDQVSLTAQSPWYNIWALAYGGGVLRLSVPFTVFVLWAFIPYMGLIMTGYGAGRLYGRDFPAERRRTILLLAGSIAVLLFLALRTFNKYGDPSPWEPQKNRIFTALSFINATKYPSSLLYFLMTLGPALALLAFSEKAAGTVASFFKTLGQVPFFYFILHLFLSQALALLASFVFTGAPGIQKFDIRAVFAAWMLVNALLYPLCLRFGKYKLAHPEKNWLRYL